MALADVTNDIMKALRRDDYSASIITEESSEHNTVIGVEDENGDEFFIVITPA